MSGAGEFALIDSIVEALGSAVRAAGVVVGPGDDAAVFEVPPGRELVVSTDTLVAGRHYPCDAEPDAVGYRAMAAAASDLAAMGADPACCTVSLTAERLAAPWARRYATGIAAAARDFHLAVVGGNLARGPASVTVAVHGHVPKGAALLRSGAAPGDGVYVTGSLGGAGLALGSDRLGRLRLGDLLPDSAERRYWMPSPRLALGARLRGVASAAIDVSDGLSSDLGHLCQASGARCVVDLADLPVFPGAQPKVAACAGDDYELAFTAPEAAADAVCAAARDCDVPVTRVATLQEAEAGTDSVAWLDNGRAVPVADGFEHF